MEENKQPGDDWKLQSIEIEFQNYGEHKGKYVGKIKFQNGEYESFQFKLYPGMTDKFISLIAEDVVKCSNNLAGRLIESLGLNK